MKAESNAVPHELSKRSPPGGDLSSAWTAPVRERLRRLAYRFVWDADRADDVVQDALTAAHVRRQGLSDPGKWWSWLCRIVVHRCHEEHRRSRRADRAKAGIERDPDRMSPRTAAIEQAELRDRVRQMLGELPDRQREVMVLRHLEEMSYEQIGDVLGIAAATARVHARAGREALRALMHERHPGWYAELSAGRGQAHADV